MVVDQTRPSSTTIFRYKFIYQYQQTNLTRVHHFEQILFRALDVVDESLWRVVWASVRPDGPDGDETVQLFAGVDDNLWRRIYFDQGCCCCCCVWNKSRIESG